MSDEEDFDEFPSITVNSSLHETSSFSMPSAEQLASQRAREEACERALLRLREEHVVQDRECAGAAVAGMAHSDSSGSEGEAALAAAVGALRVRACAAPDAPRARDVLAALLPQLPEPGFIAGYMDTLVHAPEAAVRAVTDEIAVSLADMVVAAAAADGVPAWSSEEILSVAAWLCAVSCTAAARRARRHSVLRTLHLLIDDVATAQQVEAISALLSASAIEPAAALELSDVLRSGSDRGHALGHAVAERALAQLAGAALTDGQGRSMSGIVSALPPAWRRLPPARQYLALQLLARVMPPHDQGARALLDALATTAPGQRAHSTDTLKVLVSATKLQMLFHVKK